MVVKGKDGTLWSALSGLAIEGPQKGRRLERIPSFTTQWGLWRMLHPESTVYDLYDGKRYAVAELPRKMHPDAEASISRVDPRLPAGRLVHGVEVGDKTKAYPLDEKIERACFTDEIDGKSIAIFWYGPTKSSVAFESVLDGQQLSFFADDISPDTAPFKDKETGTRWTLAGRAVDGPLRGKELTWVPGLECRWYAWSVENPGTELYEAAK